MTSSASQIKRAMLLLLILSGGYALTQLNSPDNASLNSRNAASNIAALAQSSVKINDLSIPVEIVTTYNDIQKGLSGRASLDEGRGMLFIFTKPNYYRFWMRKMNFPIDIIWIKDERIVGVTSNIPAEFNSLKPKFYTPPAPATHVLEVNAGFTKEHNISAGDYVELQSL